MAELIPAAVIMQITRVTADFVATLAKTEALSVLMQAECDKDVIGRLQGALSHLIPRQQYAKGLQHAAPLHGRFISQFLSNVLAPSVPTIQAVLAESAPGRTLILLTTALACVSPPNHVLSLLREVLAMSLNLPRVADLPECYLRACTHAPTISLIGDLMKEQLEWYVTAFEIARHGTGGDYRRASNRQIGALLIAFGRAQQAQNPTLAYANGTPPPRASGMTYVRVRNLVGMESVCAALTVMFGAEIQVGTIMPRYIKLTGFDGIVHTTVRFEYDSSGQESVGIVLLGGPIIEYLVPAGSRLPPSPQTTTAGQSYATSRVRLRSACSRLHLRSPSGWGVRAAVGAWYVRTIAANLAERVELAMGNGLDEPGKDQPVTGVTKLDVTARNWVEGFSRAIDIDNSPRPPSIIMAGEQPDDSEIEADSEDGTTLRSVSPMSQPNLLQLLYEASVTKSSLSQYLQILAAQIDDNFAQDVQALWNCPEVQASLSGLWLVCLLEAMYDGPVAALELRTGAVDEYKIPSNFADMLKRILNLIPAYANVEARPSVDHGRSRFCAVVQCGAFVLLPRVLAEEEVGDVRAPLLVMLPGSLCMDGVMVEGFYLNQDIPGSAPAQDLRTDIVSLPTDASVSHAIEYHYQEAEKGYWYSVTAAGYHLRLEHLMKGLLTIRTVKQYSEETEHSQWNKAAPHHSIVGAHAATWFNKIIYLAHGNHAGRLLAFSRVGERSERLKAVMYTGTDYRQALAYADRHQCKIVIL